jgi:hypothetical protein
LAQEALLDMTMGIKPIDKKKKKIADAKSIFDIEKSQPTLNEAYQVYIEERTLKPRTWKITVMWLMAT